MSVYIRRQIAVRSGQGSHSTLPDLPIIPYRFNDVSPRNVLKLTDGKWCSDYCTVAANTNYTIPLPASYSSAQKLAWVIRATAICKVTVIDPALGTSKFLIKATSGTTKGNHPGILMGEQRITSINILVPVGFDAPLIDFFLYEVPDLTDADSWRQGVRTLGVVP